MTTKNLKPQQAAPVQREINTTASEGGAGLTPHITWEEPDGQKKEAPFENGYYPTPFAGDDAE